LNIVEGIEDEKND